MIEMTARACRKGFAKIKGKCHRRYNENIVLMDFPPESFGKALEFEKERPLKKDEYYAVMVEDIKGRRTEYNHGRINPDTRTFFDEPKGWLGLERTGEKIYISKKLKNRHSLHRGPTVIVKVKNPKKCLELTY